MNKYYVYCHRNQITGEIFYIGKGSGGRAYKMDSRGKFWRNYVKKHGIPIVEFLYTDLEEEAAFAFEKILIERIGRRDLNKGPLVNSTNGGEGSSGMIHSKESREVMGSKKINNRNVRGKTWKHKVKRSRDLKRGNYKPRKDRGKTFDTTSRLNMSEGKRNKSRKVLQYSKNNELLKVWRSPADITESLKINGLLNCLNGRSNSCAGYIWKYEN